MNENAIVTPYEIKELGLWNDTKTASLILLKSLDSNVMSRRRRPLPVYFRKWNIFPFFLLHLSVHTLTTFSGTTNTGFRKRSKELRFWKQRLTALMYWRAKTENFKRWCHTPYHKQCACSLRDALLHDRCLRVDRGKGFVDVYFYENGETNPLFLKISRYL